MDNLTQLQQLYKFDLWSNRKIAAALNDQPFDASERCATLLAHIGAAQEIWYERIRRKDTSSLALWPEGKPVDQSIETISYMNKTWLQLLRTSNLDEVISYKNSKGKKFETPLAGILHHVIIHGQHHRAQIAILLRQHSITPPATDFIFYLRKND